MDSAPKGMQIAILIKRWHSYNKSLGFLGFFVILHYAAVGTFFMILTFLCLNTDGQLSSAHSYLYPSRVVAAWALCFPLMVGLRLWPESWLPLCLTVAFNLLVPYVLLWPITKQWRRFFRRYVNNG